VINSETASLGHTLKLIEFDTELSEIRYIESGDFTTFMFFGKDGNVSIRKFDS
jgi:hypothetical protein